MTAASTCIGRTRFSNFIIFFFGWGGGGGGGLYSYMQLCFDQLSNTQLYSNTIQLIQEYHCTLGHIYIA